MNVRAIWHIADTRERVVPPTYLIGYIEVSIGFVLPGKIAVVPGSLVAILVVFSRAPDLIHVAQLLVSFHALAIYGCSKVNMSDWIRRNKS